MAEEAYVDIPETEEENKFKVTSEHDWAFDSLFEQCCKEGECFAKVEDVVRAIQIIRPPGEEESGIGLLCNMLFKEATENQIDMATFKKVVGEWIKEITRIKQPTSSYLEEKEGNQSFSLSSPMLVSQEGSTVTPSSLRFYSHESLEADGGASSLSDSQDSQEFKLTIGRLRTENIQLRQYQSQLETQFEQREESFKQLKVAMERKTKQLLQQLEQKQLENDEFKQQSEQLEQRNEEVNRKLRNLEKDKHGLEEKLEDIEAQVSGKNLVISQLEEQLTAILGKEKKLQEHFEELDGQLSVIQEEKNSLEQQLAEVRDENESLVFQSRILEGELESVKTEMKLKDDVAVQPPLLSSTPHIHITAIARQKSIKEEIADVSEIPPSPFGAQDPHVETTPNKAGLAPPAATEGDLLDSSFEDSFQSVSADKSSQFVKEECTSVFRQNQQKAMKRIDDLLSLNPSVSIKEHSSLKILSQVDMKESNSKWEEVEKLLQTLLEERRLLQEKLKKYHDRNAELKKRIKMSTDEKIQVLTHDNEKLKTKCSNLQRELSRLSNQLSQAHNKLEEDKHTLDSRQVMIKDLRTELDHLERSRSDLQETVIKLERKVAHQQEMIQKLESEKDQLTEKCKEAAEQNQALLSQHTKALSAVLKILNPEHFKDTTDGSDDSDEIVSTELVVAQVKEKMALLEEQANRKHPKPLTDHSFVHADVPPNVTMTTDICTQTTEGDITSTYTQTTIGPPLQTTTRATFTPKIYPSRSPTSVCSSLWSSLGRVVKLVMTVLFLIVVVLLLFVGLTYLHDGHICSDPCCTSSISSLVYKTLYPHIYVEHHGMKPI